VTFTASVSPAEAVEWLLQRRSAPAVPDVMPGAEPPLPAPVPPPVVLGAPTPPAARKSRAKAADEPKINLPPRNGNGETLAITPAPVGSQTWRLPVVADVLEQGSEQDFSQDLLRKQSRTIEETLASLGAPVKVKEINRGPTVTQFGVEPLFITTRGDKTTKVKVSKIVSLADDLALALSAQRIRVEAPIPGKGLVGIEVPNMEPAVVALRDVMESEGFGRLKGTLRLALGQDVSGQAVSADLRSMPHLLIAGTTGSGKSVCINAVIAALLLQNSPDTLRLLMVDPKRVELTQYGGIPHLLAPVIVDVERVVPALRWVMREMDSRYRRFADIGARNIDDFNRRVVRAGEQAIPYIVVVVDELADMMMQAPEETERVICRLAQMARATGIHLIIATQRPSVDVVTGLIKANFPARIAFAVASSVDSRVILDSPGAERLLGRGDMLFVPPDAAQPLRLQGTFVSDDELGKLIQHWRNAVEPGKAVEPTLSMPPLVAAPEPGLAPVQPALFPELEEPPAGQQFEDPLLPTAVEVLLAENRASVSLLQRRMRIGYTRAARLMDLLSDMGMVTATAEEGQFRGVNRSVAEAFLRSLYQGGENGE
jgi:S-DNA-T family DNA segregation ATPase FtsK/SpoIIIE